MTGWKERLAWRSEQAQRDVTREVRGLLFTAVRVESHKGIAGSSWKSDNVYRIYGRNFQRNVNVGLYTSPPTRPVYPRHENARAHTNIFTINPAFYLGLVPGLLQSLSDLIRPNKRQILITSRTPSLPTCIREISVMVHIFRFLLTFVSSSVFS